MLTPSLESEGIKMFKVIRGKDESNVSGTGYVGYGVVSHSGHTVLFWRSDVSLMSKVKVASICYFDCFDDFLRIHVNSHNNYTEIEWVKFVE